ncbi:hypothetical protein [Cryptosporangium minutisporangium]|uniref:Uncharacterized protein n=1 Tax=Cryptosporangium minutisporangium TaxID=113569 RepID=A0ABP6TBD0_9ACTN
MGDRQRREDAAEVYEAVLAEVSQFCAEHGTELIEAGGPIRVVVETEHELAADRRFRANIADALAQIVQVNLGTAHVAADVVGGDGLVGKGYRLRLPGATSSEAPPPDTRPAPPTAPPAAEPPTPPAAEPASADSRFTVPRSPARPLAPASPGAPTRRRFTQPTTNPIGPPPSLEPTTVPGRASVPLVSSDAPHDPAAEALASLPPIPQLGPDRSPRALSGQRTIRFSYGAAPSPTAPSWLFTLRPAPVWVPVGRGVGGAEDGAAGMDLSLLRSIPGGRLLFLCYWQGRAHLLRTGARPDYLIALDALELATNDIVPLPRIGVLRWRHRTKPGESVLQYTISAEEA